jgi:RND superfamily putative drug exporter
VVLLAPWFYRAPATTSRTSTGTPRGGWARYARLLQRRPIIPAVLAVGVVLVLAIPALSLRLGFPDDSGTAPGSYSRIAYDLTSEGFGPGANGPFFVAVQLPEKGDVEGLGAIVGALEKTEGVAKVVPSTAMLPLYSQVLADSTVTAVQVQPATGPQDEATDQLLDRLRTQTLPPVTSATGSQTRGLHHGDHRGLLVGHGQGDAAVLAGGGPGLPHAAGVFRSPVVSLTAVVASLLSFAATGITVAVFQWGWLNDLLGVTGTGPIFPFLPIMVFAILFGLAMDYQVFLVSRMQEEWTRSRDNEVAVRRGLAGSGRVVLMAALIMASVFAACIPT